MKNAFKAIFVGAAALLLGWTTSARAAGCGDLNNDGGLTVADCTLLLDVSIGPPDPAGLCGGAGALQCGDLVADGTINGADVSACLLTVAGGETVNPLCAQGGIQQIACPGGVKDITSNITQTQVWLTGCIYRLDRVIFVQSGVTLSIQPGVKVVGKKVATPPATVSALVFLRDSKINATGTQAQPIYFTSDQHETALGTGGTLKGRGDWGGVVLNGRAPVNVPGGEGLSEGLDSVPFGGNENNDSSGLMRFVQIEFAGKVIGVDNELNLLTQNSLGSGTVMDHIHAHAGLDDAIEWFGGTIKSKFMLGSSQGDDGLDWQLGFTGSVQYGAIWQDINTVESGGSNGIEADNNENNFNASPRSNPAFCNITLCGTADQTLVAQPVNQFGVLLRRGTSGRMANMIVEGFRQAAVRIQHNESAVQFATGASPACTLVANTGMWNSVLFNNAANFDSANITGTTCTAADIGGLWTSSRNVTTTDPQLDCSVPGNMVPGIGGSATGTGIDCRTLFGDNFFDVTNYKGAFEPGGTNWAVGPWVTFPAN